MSAFFHEQRELLVVLAIVGGIVGAAWFLVHPVVAYFLAAVSAVMIGRTWREHRKAERERIAQERLALRTEIIAFTQALRTLAPESVLQEHERQLHDPALDVEGAARWILERYDALKGPILGTRDCRDPRTGAQPWPRLAALHDRLHGTTRRTITPATMTVVLPEELRCRHVLVIGRTSSGKTTMLQHLLAQDMEAGVGLGVLAVEQEMIRDEILTLVPRHRMDDVIYINPADVERPVPLNPLHVDPGEDRDLKLDETLGILLRLFGNETGGTPRTEMILRASLRTLMAVPGTTLLDIPRLLDRRDDGYRRALVREVGDDELADFWGGVYASYPKDAHAPLLSRLGPFVQSRVVRSVLCQPSASLDVRAAMDEGRILLVNLSDGVLGPKNASLLGQLVVAKIQMATMSRADAPKAKRRRFVLVLDEFQQFTGLSGTSYERMLARARKYGVEMILAHQQSGQLPESLVREILGNVGSIIAFSVGARDARRLAREFTLGSMSFGPEHLQSLRVGEAFAKLDRALFPFRTSPPLKGGSTKIRDDVVRRSRERYGVAPARSGRRGTPPALGNLDPGEVF